MLHGNRRRVKRIFRDSRNKLWRSRPDVVSAHSATNCRLRHLENRLARLTLGNGPATASSQPRLRQDWSDTRTDQNSGKARKKSYSPRFSVFQIPRGSRPKGDGGRAPAFSSRKRDDATSHRPPVALVAPLRNWRQFNVAMKSFTSVNDRYFCSSMPLSENTHVTAGAETSPFLSNCTLPVAPW